ncbi:EamA family transporter [Legionella waltersii]|uniref:4-amino-4-deoxy-L-arabinose-phosphoundecaprenol flippase subunit ArnF n=1 Tax=Legionella waltersii TaxID=66969 RepID=A0A0W1AN58_9GAMM|nr:EamA family transporter [Legionella waltersii]KTD82765.1 4-amino-4-deoxy-L-arabinose-phosphoundecaprenol flippase subunit ArnF [Legionella waltersii]SNV01176.1 4-amino-4-deoxy-L-arabinose-phosphoundecaprenol flippase subunit ArnF [Legionella waltersii]
MPIDKIILCLLCAFGSASGQLLMKVSGLAWKRSGNFYDTAVLFTIATSFLVYAITSLGWVYILKNTPLSLAYPFLAMTFILIPIADYYFFNQTFDWKDGVAALFIITGICIISMGRSST